MRPGAKQVSRTAVSQYFALATVLCNHTQHSCGVAFPTARINPFRIVRFQVLDTLIAVIVGGGVLGLTKLFPISFWGFLGFFTMVLTIGFVLWVNHKRTVRFRHPETKRLRAVYASNYAFCRMDYRDVPSKLRLNALREWRIWTPTILIFHTLPRIPCKDQRLSRDRGTQAA